MRNIALLSIAFLLGACSNGTPAAAVLTQPTAMEQPTQPDSGPTDEQGQPTEEPESPTEEPEMKLLSSAFEQEEPIPAVHSCDGEDISPRLTWTNPPEGAESFALIMDDPDAPVGIWVHWVLFNLPPAARSLPEAVPPDPTLGNGAIHGSNSWNTIGYGGPCPPGGQHRYFFKLYALDEPLNLEVGATKEQVVAAMEGHIVAETELMGTYTR